jgi:hypothetical protein
MSRDIHDGPLVYLGRNAYNRVLASAREVSHKTLGRLHLLHDHFPGGLPAEAVAWLQAIEDDPRRERRSTPRYAVPSGSLEVSATHPPQAEFRGQLANRSPWGLALLSPRLVKVGTVVSLRAADDPGAPWVQVEVRYCRPREEGWAVGCLFLRTPVGDPARTDAPRTGERSVDGAS